jgi:hypothetical protein
MDRAGLEDLQQRIHDTRMSVFAMHVKGAPLTEAFITALTAHASLASHVAQRLEPVPAPVVVPVTKRRRRRSSSSESDSVPAAKRARVKESSSESDSSSDVAEPPSKPNEDDPVRQRVAAFFLKHEKEEDVLKAKLVAYAGLQRQTLERWLNYLTNQSALRSTRRMNDRAAFARIVTWLEKNQ